MKNIWLGIFLVSLASLITELSLIRVFDVLFYPNIAYLIITCSLFAFGLAGVYTVIRPLKAGSDVPRNMGYWALALAISIAIILPLLNWLPFNFNQLSEQPLLQVTYFALMYISIAAPFFITGRILSTLFSSYAGSIQKLYFWDLVGAALGSLIIIPFISKIGPGGLLFLSAGIALIGSALFSGRRGWTLAAGAVSLVLIVSPLVYAPNYFDFTEHQGKRGVKFARESGLIETTIWDPISKIDVIGYENVRYIAFDGGSQTSLFYPFNGDFQDLRERLPAELNQHFWQRGVLASHFLKEGSHPRVLVIGSAGGQEIKAALLYGASQVDGVELVKVVVDLGKGKYSAYIGNIFNLPNVQVHAGEGRNFLRANATRYDIIQIFSNHTSSSVAAGTGAVATNYLQTAEAYQDYFTHLTPDGILHINHFYYPKMVTTAALAWKQMGRSDFQKHVLVFDYDQDDTLPTLLIKMQPWTADEVAKAQEFFSARMPGDPGLYTLVVNPLDPSNSTLPADYFSGELSAASLESAQTRIIPATDDRPYFNLLLKTLSPFPNGFMAFLKDPLRGMPMGLAAVFLSGGVALFYGGIFIISPLRFSSLGRKRWPRMAETLVYFMGLGAGFIIIEFVFIQLFMHLIGSPLYTYSVVIFVMLFGAGLGSLTSQKFKISPARRWWWPFVGIFASVGTMVLIFTPVSQIFLSAPVLVRMGVAGILMFPVGFFLGMPFPLGVLALEKRPRGAIAWAWGMNGLFTVVGGLLGVIFSILWGFKITLLIACVLYALAMVMFSRIRGLSQKGEVHLGELEDQRVLG